MYLPVRLDVLMSLFGSGIVMVLLERIEPDSLKVFRAMAGSWYENG
jgi:hypothetical protein